MATASDIPSIREQVIYSSGEVAATLSWNMVNGYLLYYYSNVAFIPIAALGTLMLLTRVFDALVDPLMGIVVDRTRTRWGQARPYLLFASVPFGVACVLTFAVPDIPATGKIVYAYVTFTVLGLLYSVLYIPYGAMQPMLTRDPVAKRRIAGFRAMASSIASIVVYGSINWITSLTGPAHRASGYLLAAAVFAFMTSANFLLIFWACKERFVTAAVGSYRSIGRELRNLSRNPVWLFVSAYGLITFIRLGSMLAVAAYFVNDVMHKPWMMGILLPLVSVAILLGGLASSSIIGRWGQRRANIAVLISSMLLYLLLPYVISRPLLFYPLYMLANAGSGVVAASLFASCTDAVTYQETRFGVSSAGLVYASVSFSIKVGMAVGAALVAYVLAWVAYEPAAISPRAVKAVGWLFFDLPIVLGALQLACALVYRGTDGAVESG